MKHIKSGVILLVAVLLFFAFCLGMYLGRQSSPGEILLCTEKACTEAETTAQEEAPAGSSEPENETPSVQVETASEECGRINPNTASKEALMSLPGIGETLAERMIEYRETHGKFHSPEDLLNVSGIGEKKLDAILEYITLEE